MTSRLLTTLAYISLKHTAFPVNGPRTNDITTHILLHYHAPKVTFRFLWCSRVSQFRFNTSPLVPYACGIYFLVLTNSPTFSSADICLVEIKTCTLVWRATGKRAMFDKDTCVDVLPDILLECPEHYFLWKDGTVTLLERNFTSIPCLFFCGSKIVVCEQSLILLTLHLNVSILNISNFVTNNYSIIISMVLVAVSALPGQRSSQSLRSCLRIICMPAWICRRGLSTSSNR